MKTDEEYREELKKLVKKNVISICAKFSKHAKDVRDLENWLYSKTAFLQKIYDAQLKKLSISTRIYYVINCIEKPIKCKNSNCSKYVVRNINIIHGFSGYCCDKCAKSDKETLEKRMNTNLIRRGYRFPAQNKSILQKMQNTCLKRYGVKNPGSSEEIKLKVKNTCLKHFGVPYSSQSKEHKAYYADKTFVEKLLRNNQKRNEKIIRSGPLRQKN